MNLNKGLDISDSNHTLSKQKKKRLKMPILNAKRELHTVLDKTLVFLYRSPRGEINLNKVSRHLGFESRFIKKYAFKKKTLTLDVACRFSAKR